MKGDPLLIAFWVIFWTMAATVSKSPRSSMVDCVLTPAGTPVVGSTGRVMASWPRSAVQTPQGLARISATAFVVASVGDGAE